MANDNKELKTGINEFALTIELTPEQVKNLIADGLKARGTIVEKCTFNVEKIRKGYGPGEYDELEFIGAKCIVKISVP